MDGIFSIPMVGSTSSLPHISHYPVLPSGCWIRAKSPCTKSLKSPRKYQGFGGFQVQKPHSWACPLLHDYVESHFLAENMEKHALIISYMRSLRSIYHHSASKPATVLQLFILPSNCWLCTSNCWFWASSCWLCRPPAQRSASRFVINLNNPIPPDHQHTPRHHDGFEVGTKSDGTLW